MIAGKSFYSPYGEKTPAANADTLRFYVSGVCDSFIEENKAEAWGDAVVTKPISVEAIHAWRKENPEAFIAAFA